LSIKVCASKGTFAWREVIAEGGMIPVLPSQRIIMKKPSKKMLVQIEHVINVIQNDRVRNDGDGEYILVTDEEAAALRQLSGVLMQHLGPFPNIDWRTR